MLRRMTEKSDGRKLVGEYRLSLAHKSFVRRALDPEAPGPDDNYHQSAVLKFAFLVEPRIDLKRLERAVERLCRRHDGLRLSLGRQGDEWRACVWDRHRTGVVVENVGDVDRSELTSMAAAIAARPLNLFQDDLIQFRLLRSERVGDVLLVRAHHAIVDGHSMLILVEDMLKLLIGLPLVGAGLSHEKYLSELETLTPRQQEENQRYWDSIIHPVLPNPGLGRFGAGKPVPRRIFDPTDIREVPIRIPTERFEELPSLVGAPGQTPFSILFAAFAQAYLDISGLPGIYVVTFIDRTSAKLANYVGCASMSIPVRCENIGGLPLCKFAESLSQQIREGVAHLPSEAGLPYLSADWIVHEGGGAMRHLACGMVFTGGRAKRSPFAPALQAQAGIANKIGPLTVTRLAIPTQGYAPSGIEFAVLPDATGVGLSFSYHNRYYSDEAMAQFKRRMEELLKLPLDPVMDDEPA